ncbi:MAG: hypothetical protein DVB23_002021 [Verrucomicrobia bacterium]|jgi:hypothetical protein|nr:MAG: hypothetical protein DVB23_002021 [Verrucomicrobiota bacterium]
MVMVPLGAITSTKPSSTNMFWRRPSFPLDRVLAESLEPRILYSATPLAAFPIPESVPTWTDVPAHVSQPWTEIATSGIDQALESEHHLSHLLDQTASQEEWALLGDWKKPSLP